MESNSLNKHHEKRKTLSTLLLYMCSCLICIDSTGSTFQSKSYVNQ